MDQAERSELLREMASKDRASEPEEDRVVIERDQLMSEETEEDQEYWKKEQAAVQAPPVMIREVFDMIGFVRSVLDPRVIIEAREIGCGEEELQRIQGRMQEWADALEKREDESFPQRQIRLNQLAEKLFPETSHGCGCRSIGMKLVHGNFRRRDGKMVNGVDYMTLCGCETGDGKHDYLEALRSHRRGGRKKKPQNPEDAIPF